MPKSSPTCLLSVFACVCCCCPILPPTKTVSTPGCRSFSVEAVQAAVDEQQLGLQGLRALLLMYQQQLADVRAIPAFV